MHWSIPAGKLHPAFPLVRGSPSAVPVTRSTESVGSREAPVPIRVASPCNAVSRRYVATGLQPLCLMAERGLHSCGHPGAGSSAFARNYGASELGSPRPGW